MMQYVNTRPPKLAKALELIGKNTPAALLLCEEYRKEDPQDNWVYHIMTLAHRRMGNHELMHKAANICVKREPKNDSSYYHRAEAAYHLGKYSDAIADAKKSFSLDYDGTSGSLPHRLAALSYAKLGDVDNAVKTASETPELEPGEWYPPIKPLPAGTKTQFVETVRQMAQNVKAGK